MIKSFREWHINYLPYRGGYEVYIREDKGKRIVTNIALTVEDYIEGELTSPCMIMEQNEAQQIMDALWLAGVRPNNGEGSDAQVNSIKNHLEDMRKIVFKSLKMDNGSE